MSTTNEDAIPWHALQKVAAAADLEDGDPGERLVIDEPVAGFLSIRDDGRLVLTTAEGEFVEPIRSLDARSGA